MTAIEHLSAPAADPAHRQPHLRMYAVQAPPVQALADSSSPPHDAQTATMSRVPIAALLRPDSVDKFTFQGRTYYRFRNDTYNFPADDIEYERLDVAHQLIYPLALDNQLHLAHLRTPPRRILDVGFGSGFWMGDMAKQYPHAEIIGIDLDDTPRIGAQDRRAPGPGLHFKTPVDFNAPQWPLEDSSVDLVHMAQLVGCVPDWASHYRKAYRCLRPGIGHIEHVEIDWAPRTTDTQFPAEARDVYNWWHWVKQASDLSGKSLAYREDTEELLEQAGFRDVSHRRIRIPLFWHGEVDRKDLFLAHGYQTMMGHSGTQSFHGFCMLLLTRYLHFTPQQVQDLCDNVVTIIQDKVNGPRLHINLHVWTARRPQT